MVNSQEGLGKPSSAPHILFPIFQVPCIYSLPCSFDPTALHHRIRRAFRHLRQRAPSTRNPRVPVLWSSQSLNWRFSRLSVSSPLLLLPETSRPCPAPSSPSLPSSPAFCLSLGFP